jgi:hypothetical protein
MIAQAGLSASGLFDFSTLRAVAALPEFREKMTAQTTPEQTPTLDCQRVYVACPRGGGALVGVCARGARVRDAIGQDSLPILGC